MDILEEGRSTEVTYLVDGMRTDDAYGGESQTVYLEPSVIKRFGG